MKLTKLQIMHLLALAPGERSSYPGLNLGVLNSLERKGLVSAKRGLGSVFMPRNAIKWCITPEGSKLIFNHKLEDCRDAN